MDKIEGIGQALRPVGAAGLRGVSASAAGATQGFGDSLSRALRGVSDELNRADALQKKFQLGDPAVTIEETMVSMQSASLSFQALVQVRNRLVTAYQDIMNMQV